MDNLQNEKKRNMTHIGDRLSSLVGKTPVKSEVTQFGTKHTYKTEITEKDGKSVRANVVVVIQKDNGRITYKIVTVYPDKKGE